ncbi:hypothetical protein C0Q70_16223 [Pomacea canaliculata]|uniref:Uncharacterized protein n=1 Tax=Pomacea canaliculata TaxID=400727 RepID=A0A2T7NP85_POMCA|nr:hypothetical protein C0Q70_16223 [Pomacea canaliculata]
MCACLQEKRTALSFSAGVIKLDLAPALRGKKQAILAVCSRNVNNWAFILSSDGASRSRDFASYASKHPSPCLGTTSIRGPEEVGGTVIGTTLIPNEQRGKGKRERGV